MQPILCVLSRVHPQTGLSLRPFLPGLLISKRAGQSTGFSQDVLCACSPFAAKLGIVRDAGPGGGGPAELSRNTSLRAYGAIKQASIACISAFISPH